MGSAEGAGEGAEDLEQAGNAVIKVAEAVDPQVGRYTARAAGNYRIF